MNYFGISEYYRPIPEIDQWLRRRLRMCYFKQWRRARTKVRELRKLGTSLHAAISVAISRKGPWRLSRTLATQTGMTNDWLKDQGLLSVKELWVHIHYPATRLAGAERSANQGLYPKEAQSTFWASVMSTLKCRK